MTTAEEIRSRLAPRVLPITVPGYRGFIRTWTAADWCRLYRLQVACWWDLWPARVVALSLCGEDGTRLFPEAREVPGIKVRTVVKIAQRAIELNDFPGRPAEIVGTEAGDLAGLIRVEAGGITFHLRRLVGVDRREYHAWRAGRRPDPGIPALAFAFVRAVVNEDGARLFSDPNDVAGLDGRTVVAVGRVAGKRVKDREPRG